MPNTLAHLGIQGVATRSLLRSAEAKWILLGCIIPDIPWVLQRVVRALESDINLYDLRLYAVVQASFLFTLILSGTVAFLSEKPGRVFAILSLNSLFHLLLDAYQTKWANGVHLFAPFSWDLLNLKLFWPENLPTHIFTVFGLGYILWAWKKEWGQTTHFGLPTGTRFLLILVLSTAYFLLPFAFKEEVESLDNHYVKTLREQALRSGRPVEFDRAGFVISEHGGILKIFTGEELMATGNIPIHSGTVSIRGRFIDPHKVFITEFHEHPASFRDMASYLGLFMVAAFWLTAPLERVFRKDYRTKFLSE